MLADLLGGMWEDENHESNTEDEDYAFALQLSEYANNSGTLSGNNNGQLNDKALDVKKPLSVVDESWELIDPVPDIRQLFMQFNTAYFDGKVACVEVKWSNKMTLCAGLCRYEGRGGLCGISLSLPLLKLRPRSDLVNTLLHEMIHALLFVTNNNKDHGAHGDEFHKHMYRINKQSGSKITVYHTFHDEVNLYRQHWWKCDGPCAKRHPFYGIVRRSMNRAPGRNDRWWADHQKSCGGVFKKIKEPDKDETKKKTTKNIEKDNNMKKTKKTEKDNVKKPGSSNVNKITDFLKKSPGKVENESKNENNNNKKDVLKNTSFWNNQSSTSSKIGSFQGLMGKSTDNEIFSGSSNSSSGNVHGFKMTARKNNETTIDSFSGKGMKISVSPVKGVKKGQTSSSGNRESFLKKVEKQTATKNKDALSMTGGSATSDRGSKMRSTSSHGSRESFLKKIEDDMLKSKGVKRENITRRTDNENDRSKKPRLLVNNTSNTEIPKTSSQSKLVPDVISDNENDRSKKSRLLVNNTSNTEIPKPSLHSKLVPEVISIDDSADDEILSGIDDSFLTNDVNLVECPACPARIPENKLNEHLDNCLLK